MCHKNVIKERKYFQYGILQMILYCKIWIIQSCTTKVNQGIQKKFKALSRNKVLAFLTEKDFNGKETFYHLMVDRKDKNVKSLIDTLFCYWATQLVEED